MLLLRGGTEGWDKCFYTAEGEEESNLTEKSLLERQG